VRGDRVFWAEDFSCPFLGFGKSYAIMKRIQTLVVLLGLAMGMMMLTGCNKDETSSGTASTNATPTTPAPTNK
jgi:uncharacterized lipoprotein YajG